MEWTLLSPSSSRSEVNFPSLCEVKDEHSHLFPSKPIPGMMEHFQPLLITLDKCMSSCPVALAEDVEELLKKDYPNAISDQKLISFIEYVHLARLRGIPIRCDQAFSKPKYMWFQHNKESWFNISTTDQAVNVDVKDTETLVQSTDIEDQPEPNLKHDNVKEENLNIPEITIPASTGSTRAGQEGDTKVNGPNSTSNSVMKNTTSERNRVERILISSIIQYTHKEFKKHQLNHSHYFDFIHDYWQNGKKGREMMQFYQKEQVFKIIVSMIKDKHAFCKDIDLLKLVECIIVITIVRNLQHGSTIPFSLLQSSIVDTYPEILSSQLDSKSQMDKKITSLLLRLSKQGLYMPIICKQGLEEIDISEALKLVDMYKFKSSNVIRLNPILTPFLSRKE